MAVYAKGDIVSAQIRRSGDWEPEIFPALSRFLPQESTREEKPTGLAPAFVDIGSNIGFHTFNWSRSHDVFAFEPFVKNLQLQNMTRCLNPQLARRIRLFPVGLAARASRCELYQQEEINIGDTHSVCGDDEASLAKARAPFLKARYAKLGESRTVTLDSLAPRSLYAREKVLKIDVEGYEYLALSGAERLMTIGRPPAAVHAEVFQLDDLGSKRKEKATFFAMLGRWGYEPRDVLNPAARPQPNARDVLFVLQPAARAAAWARWLELGGKSKALSSLRAKAELQVRASN